LGLVVGVSAAFAREYADNAVHSRDEVQGITRTPVLGLVPRIRPGRALSARLGNRVRALLPGPSRRDVRGAKGSEWAFATDDAMNWSVAREVFNGLHAKVVFAAGREARRTLIVTSPLPGDGKTTIAVNFAGTVARQGQKVLLIDADLRRGIVHSLFQLPRSPGFADVLAGAIDIGAAIRVVPVADGRVLHVLPRGTPNDDPAGTLEPARVQAFTDTMAAEFDWVIIDSPPLNVVADASLLVATGAGVILVARAGVTPTAALAYAAEQLQSIQATLIGTILNAIDKREASYDSAFRYYAYATGYHASMSDTNTGRWRRGAAPADPL
jgi:capsular exopolysaccharide synthesis family protein